MSSVRTSTRGSSGRRLTPAKRCSSARDEDITWSPGKRKKLETSKGPPSMGTEREAQCYLKSSQSGVTAATLSSTPRIVRVARLRERVRSNGSQLGDDDGLAAKEEQELMRNIRPCATQMDTFDREEELELLEAAEMIEAGEMSMGQQSGGSSWSSSCQRSGMNQFPTQVQASSMPVRENQFNAVNVIRSPPPLTVRDGLSSSSPPSAPLRKPARPSGEKKLIPGTQVNDDWSDIELDDLEAACTQVECAVAALKDPAAETAKGVDYDDDFGSLVSEDLLAAMEEIEAAAERAAGTDEQPPWGKWAKHIESRLSSEKPQINSPAHEVHLTLENGKAVVLKGPWYWFWQGHCNKLVLAGDPVNLVLADEKDAEAPVVICGETGNFLIFHPSILLSGTTVSNALPCHRKTLLQYLLSDVGYGAQNNIYATVGNAVHAILQSSLMFGRGRLDEGYVRQAIEESKMDLWFSGFSNASVLERHVRERVPQIAKWLSEVIPAKFSRMIAAEQNVHCQKFGLKGKIDAVMELTGGQGKACLEIKTGKPWHTHMGQVMLYHLLMMDLYGEEAVKGGLLEVGYFNGNRNQRGPPGGAPPSAEVSEVTPNPTELDNLVCVRNTLALHLARKTLPPPIGSKWECERCPLASHCVAAHVVLEKRSATEFGCAPPVVVDSSGGLLAEYIRKWWRWLRREERAGDHAPVDVLENARVMEILLGEGKQLWRVEGDACGQEISSGDELHVSYQRYGPRNIATGEVTEVSSQGSRIIVVLSMRDDGMPDIPPTHGDIEDLERMATDANKSVYVNSKRLFKLTRVDWGSAGQTKRNRSLLLELAHDSSGRGWAAILAGAAKVQLPRLRPWVAVPVPYEIRPAFETLNEGQKRAVCAALELVRQGGSELTGDRWALPVCGYPGTGKSSMLAVLLLGLRYGSERRVLLVSHTHTAVDNLLLKTKELAGTNNLKDFDFVRLGRSSSTSVKPELAEHYPPSEWPSVESISDFLRTRGGRLVACTALACHNALLWPPKPPNEEDVPTQPPRVNSSQPKILDKGLPQPPDFDIVLVDEAGQAADSTLWCSLKLATRGAILVGDQYQLPPVVKDRKCRDEGMSETLFARCAREVASIELTAQYRMCRGIQRFVNELFYEGKLKCGSREVEDAKMPRVFTTALAGPWIEEMWNPEQPVVMIDVSQWRSAAKEEFISAADEKEDGRVYSRAEAQVIKSFVTTVPRHSVASEDMVILSPYVKQVKLIQGLLAAGDRSDVEIMTVDRSQGRDWKVVVISLVRSRSLDNERGGDASTDVL
ncbi:hypothetical protein FOZ61_008856, partial [Perkinsus olseni]